MSDEQKIAPVAPTKQTNMPGMVLVVGLIVAVIAAVFFVIRTNTLKDKNAQLQSQLEKTEADLERAKVDLDQAKVDLDQAKVEIAHLQPLATKARTLPVKVSFRKALLGDGKVLVLHNTATKNLAVSVKITDPTSNRSKDFRVVMDGLAVKEIGALEGWRVASGDKIQIENVDYDPILKTAP